MGFLSIETLKGILLELEPKLDDAQLMEIVDEVDEDGSGTIDFDGKNAKLRSCKAPSFTQGQAYVHELRVGSGWGIHFAGTLCIARLQPCYVNF